MSPIQKENEHHMLKPLEEIQNGSDTNKINIDKSN